MQTAPCAPLTLGELWCCMHKEECRIWWRMGVVGCGGAWVGWRLGGVVWCGFCVLLVVVVVVVVVRGGGAY